MEGHTERRILDQPLATDLGPIRATSPRQLPTNHDYDGEAAALIHEYQSDQPSTMAAPAAVPWCLIEHRR